MNAENNICKDPTSRADILNGHRSSDQAIDVMLHSSGIHEILTVGSRKPSRP